MATSDWWTGILTPDQVSQYNNTYANSGYQGSADWNSMDPTLRAGIMSGNVDVNMLSEAQRAAIPSAQTMYGAPDGNHPTMPTAPTGAAAPSVNLNAYTPSPYLGAIGQGLRDQFTGFMNDGLAANRGAAVAAGGVGGSRQGIMEARTMTDAGKGFDSALANLYGQDYNNQMNRNLQQYGMDQNYALGNKSADNNFFLGQGQLALGNKTADQNYNLGNQGQQLGFYNTQRALDQGDTRLGMDLYSLGTQAPWAPLQNANGIYGNYTGFGNTSNNSSAGGGTLGGIGGLLGGATYAANRGWWS